MPTWFWLLAGLAAAPFWWPVAAALVRDARAADAGGDELAPPPARPRTGDDARERELRRRRVPRRFPDEGLTWSRRRLTNRAWETGRPRTPRARSGGFDRA